jgi:hypothetical protein
MWLVKAQSRAKSDPYQRASASLPRLHRLPSDKTATFLDSLSYHYPNSISNQIYPTPFLFKFLHQDINSSICQYHND